MMVYNMFRIIYYLFLKLDMMVSGFLLVEVAMTDSSKAYRQVDLAYGRTPGTPESNEGHIKWDRSSVLIL